MSRQGWESILQSNQSPLGNMFPWWMVRILLETHHNWPIFHVVPYQGDLLWGHLGLFPELLCCFAQVCVSVFLVVKWGLKTSWRTGSYTLERLTKPLPNSERARTKWPTSWKPIFLPHRLEKGTCPLDLRMFLHSFPLSILYTLFHPCFSVLKAWLVLKLNWLFPQQWASSLDLLSPVPLFPPSFHISSGFCYFPYICFEGFSNKVVRRCFLRVFYHKFFLLSCLSTLLRRTLVT